LNYKGGFTDNRFFDLGHGVFGFENHDPAVGSRLVAREPYAWRFCPFSRYESGNSQTKGAQAVAIGVSFDQDVFGLALPRVVQNRSDVPSGLEWKVSSGRSLTKISKGSF
jgi:hypothetical protein